MSIPIIERHKLIRAEWARNFSDATMEAITRIIVSTRINLGHCEAEEKAKELRELIESGISETDFLQRLIDSYPDELRLNHKIGEGTEKYSSLLKYKSYYVYDFEREAIQVIEGDEYK